MMLHMGVVVYELRNGKGYGMRWTLDLERRDATEAVNSHQEASQRSEQSAAGPEVAPEDWQIIRTTFRGFLEPVADMDHELEDDV